MVWARGVRWRAALAGSLVAFGVGLSAVANPAPTLAECTSLDPWPSFRQAAPSAKTILIGTVTWTPGGEVNNRFTLRVDEVLRGDVPGEIEITRLHSGVPETICPGGSSLIVRDVGERLAIAYDAHVPGQRRTITAVAIVKPSPRHRFFLPEMERLSVAEVRAIAAEPPRTEASRPALLGHPVRRGDLPDAIPWIAGFAALLTMLVRVRRHARPA